MHSSSTQRTVHTRPGRTVDSLHGYAEARAQQFDVSTVDRSDRCAVCAQSNAIPRALRWRAITHDKASGTFAIIAFLLGYVTTKHVEIRMTTHHRLCPKCARTCRTRITITAVGKNFLFGILLLLLFPVVPLTVFLISAPFIAPDQVAGFGRLWIPAAAVTGFFYLLLRMMRRESLPGRLKTVARYPFEPIAVERLGQEETAVKVLRN